MHFIAWFIISIEMIHNMSSVLKVISVRYMIHDGHPSIETEQKYIAIVDKIKWIRTICKI